MNILFEAYRYRISAKKVLEEPWSKIYLDHDPDPDVFKSLIRIRSKIVRIRNTAGEGTVTVPVLYKPIGCCSPIAPII
jgi:hypothetical protein